MSQRAREWYIITGLLILALAILFGLHGQPLSRLADLLTKIAFAILVTAVVRLLALLLVAPDSSASFRALGMLRIIDPLGDANLQKQLAGAREIKVLKTWFPETPTIEQGLREAIKRERPAQVTLLLARPDSAVLGERSTGAGEDWSHGALMVIRALRHVTQWVGDRENVNVEVGLYDSWPGCPVIWFDGKALMGFYFRDQSSPRWPWVEVEAGSKLDKILTDQFQSLWWHEKTIRFSKASELAQWLARVTPGAARPIVIADQVGPAREVPGDGG